MKKFFAVLALCLMAVGCVSPDGPVTDNKVLRITNSIYLDVRTVVTDPEVMVLFSDQELDRLADLETKYLDVADKLRAFPEDEESVEQISWIATEILMIMNEVEFIEKYRPYIAAIRISIKVLRNHIS